MRSNQLSYTPTIRIQATVPKATSLLVELIGIEPTTYALRMQKNGISFHFNAFQFAPFGIANC